jgi:hypothetical protein
MPRRVNTESYEPCRFRGCANAVCPIHKDARRCQPSYGCVNIASDHDTDLGIRR